MIGRSGVGPGNGDGHRVGAEPGVGPSPRRHRRALIGDVDERDRDEAGARAHLAVGADPADMVRIAQGDDRDAGLLRLRDAEHCRLARDDLAPAAVAVIDDHRPGLADHMPLDVGRRLAGAEVAQVVGDHPDAVAVVPAQIGLDQMVGDNRRLFRRAAGGGKDALDGACEFGVVDDLHDGTSDPVGRRLLASPMRNIRGSMAWEVEYQQDRIAATAFDPRRSAGACSLCRSGAAG